MTWRRRASVAMRVRPAIVLILAVCAAVALPTPALSQQTPPSDIPALKTTPELADDPPAILSLLAEQQQLLDDLPAIDDAIDPAAAAASISPSHSTSHAPHSPHSNHTHKHAVEAEAEAEEDPNRLVAHGSHFHTAAEFAASSGYILLLMLGTVIACQTGLYYWKKYHLQSFDMAALFGLWAIPAVWSVWGGYWRMLIVWSCYTAVTGWVGRRALQRPVDRRTPRLVYQYFHACYRLCYGCAFVGYCLLMSDFLGVSLLLPEALTPLSPTGVLLMFYGLYYGVLSRDLCALCGMLMAVNLGYVGRKGEMPSKTLPLNTCAICDHPLHASVRLTDSRPGEAEEPTFSTPCGHQFHSYCLRGWTIIGKRDTCPSCSEKVNVRDVVGRAPWDQTAVAWGWILDAVRVMVVYNPIILLITQTVVNFVW